MMLVLLLVGCSTPEAFGERYERAYCEAVETCGWYTGEVLAATLEVDCAEGYLAGIWADQCPGWTPDKERDDACIEQLETCAENEVSLCDRDLFGCE